MYRELAGTAESLVQQYSALKQSLERKRIDVQARLTQARADLAAIYLPQLTRDHIQSAQTLTGFRGFSRRDPLKAMHNERHRLEALIQKIAAMETYQRRAFLVGPVGEYTRKLEEAQELLAPWQLECDKFESLRDFPALVEVGYDTPEYTVRWWEPMYWRYWASGDEICDALGMGDFGDDVLPAYEKVRVPRDQWKQQVSAAEAKMQEVHALVQRHDQAQARLQQLPQVYLAEAQKLLAQHLEMADPALLAQWAADDRGIIMGLRRIGGMQAKIDFFTDAIERGLSGAIQDFENRARKYRRKVGKYQRSKHYHRTIPERELDRKFPAKVGKYQARVEKLSLLADRVESYDRYDAFELDNPPELWFHQFTRGKRPSRLTPSIRGWYDRNPGRTPNLDPDVQQKKVAAAAPATSRLEELGYLS
ncbi:MAG: hypothetical protein AAFV53_09370 [Myxococcota bacterium]